MPSLTYQLGMDPRGFSAGLGQARADFRSTRAEFERGGGLLGGISAVAGGNIIAQLSGRILALGGDAMETAARMDSLERALGAIGDQSLSVQGKMARLQELAKLPGLGLEEAAAGVIRLQGAGMGFDTAVRTVREFGNALAAVGAGKNELDGVTLALAQISAKGMVSAEEINQIAERLPQIRTLMQTAFGTASTEAIQAMGLSAEEFITGITDKLSEAARVTGGMRNSMENFSDSWKRTKASLGGFAQALVSPFRDAAAAAMDWVNMTDRGVQATEEVEAAAGRTAAQIREQAAAAAEVAARQKEAAAAEERRMAARAALGLRQDVTGQYQKRLLGATTPGERAEISRGIISEIQATFGTIDELKARLQRALSAEDFEGALLTKRLMDELKEAQKAVADFAGAQAALFTQVDTGNLTPITPQETPEAAQARKEAMDAHAAALDMAQAEIDGNKTKLDQLRTEQKIREEIKRLMAAGVDEQTAKAMANKLVNAQNAAATAADRTDPGTIGGRRLARQERPEAPKVRAKKLTEEEAAARKFWNTRESSRKRMGWDTPEDFLKKSGRGRMDRDKFNEALRKLREEKQMQDNSKQQLKTLEAIENHLKQVTVA